MSRSDGNWDRIHLRMDGGWSRRHLMNTYSTRTPTFRHTHYTLWTQSGLYVLQIKEKHLKNWQNPACLQLHRNGELLFRRWRDCSGPGPSAAAVFAHEKAGKLQGMETPIKQIPDLISVIQKVRIPPKPKASRIEVISGVSCLVGCQLLLVGDVVIRWRSRPVEEATLEHL